MEFKNDFIVRQLTEGEPIPYPLLLLADETIEAINKYIFNSEIYVCEADQSTIAVYVLQIIDQQSIEIKNIAVDPFFQGRGIGTDVLKKIAEDTSERGFTALLIGTGDNSFKQLELYQKSGFRKFTVIRDFFIDNYPKAIYENGKQLKDMIMLKKDIGNYIK